MSIGSMPCFFTPITVTSRTPDLASAKAKLNVMGVWFPALKANGDPADFMDDNDQLVEGIPYYRYDALIDEETGVETGAEEVLLRVATEAKPLLEQAVAQDPQHARALGALGLAYQNEGQHLEGRKDEKKDYF